jgi:hypothetical protein
MSQPHDFNDPNTKNIASHNLIADARVILVHGWIDENGTLRADAAAPTYDQDARPGDAVRAQLEQEAAAAEGAIPDAI